MISVSISKTNSKESVKISKWNEKRSDECTWIEFSVLPKCPNVWNSISASSADPRDLRHQSTLLVGLRVGWENNFDPAPPPTRAKPTRPTDPKMGIPFGMEGIMMAV
jgi:hypothetical protein